MEITKTVCESFCDDCKKITPHENELMVEQVTVTREVRTRQFTCTKCGGSTQQDG